MLRNTRLRCSSYDQLFMRRVKRAYSNYASAMENERQSPVSKEAFVDIDEKGPAWYLGHMAKTARILDEKMDEFDFLIELRDARLPFTSQNTILEKFSRDKPRIIVFNKADLSNEEMNRMLHQYYEDNGHYTLFTAAKRTWKDTVLAVQKFVNGVLPPKKYKLTAHIGCVVGMPNVGKSTLINSLRMAHEFQFHREDFRRPRAQEEVSMMPGTTRGVKLVPLSRDPNIVLYDTPGLTMPGTVHKEAGLKLAACGILPTNNLTLTDASVARYVYEVLAAAGANEHVADCLHLPRAPLSFEDCVMMLCERSGRSTSNQVGATDFIHTYQILINDFRTGKLGRVTLDRLPRKMLPTAANSEFQNEEQRQQEEETLRQKRAAASAWDDLDDATVVYEHTVESTDVTDSNEPEYVRSVMRAVHSSPDHADSTVISRKRGPVAKEAVASCTDHLFNRRRVSTATSTAEANRSSSSSSSSGGGGSSSSSSSSSSKKKMTPSRSGRHLSGMQLSSILQKRV